MNTRFDTLAEAATYNDSNDGGYMEFTKFANELPYPRIDAEENLAEAKLLMPSYGGAAGELTAVLTYCFQSYVTPTYDELRSALGGISKCEMTHHRLLGDAIFALGGYPMMGARSYWNGNYINYTPSPKKFIALDIQAEKTAIANYERTILNVSSENVKSLLERIILDEEIHIKILEELLHNI